MKTLLPLVLCFLALTGLRSQISITANMPSSIPSGTSVDAEVKINKGAIGNFAKYQMDLPAGYSVSGVDVKGGNFTFENQRAKIVWVSVPSDPEFTVTFKITADGSASNQGAIVQKFFYLENNEKKEVEGNTITLGGGSSMASASGGSSSNSTPVETVKSTPVETVKSEPVETVKSTPVETVKSEPVETVKSTPVETVKSTPVETVKSTPVETSKPVASSSSSSSASMEGYTYKVQLGAYSSEPSKSKFAAAGSVSIDMVDGLYKVTSGSFKNKEEAMKHRDALQGKGYNGFIVTYKNGQRVK